MNITEYLCANEDKDDRAGDVFICSSHFRMAHVFLRNI